MIVEDHYEQRSCLAAMAREAGIPVVFEADNGNEALRVLEHLTSPPTVIMLDLEMPGMDGIELIEHLHARGAHVPMLVVSRQDLALIRSVGAMIEQLEMPLLGLLQKPVDPQEMRALLNARPRQVARHATTVRPFLKAAAVKGPTRSELAQAIESGQIVAHYQPKVDIAELRAVGVEALARWTHPELGDIPPDRFIPLAEREGLIHSLTMSILDQSLAQTARWNNSGTRLTVAVNLSPQLLESHGLVDEIVRLQQHHGIAPDQVTLEITESASASSFASALGVLTRLRLKGFGLSIDDFGTGFSSMQQLARMPFTEVKFDRSLVRGATRFDNYRVILKSALRMSRELGLVTVAEGIETCADLDMLSDFGCTLGQGWLIAKPMSAQALPLWTAQHRLGRAALCAELPSVRRPNR